MNRDEVGVVLAFSTAFDMSAFISLQMKLWKPSNPWSEDANSTPSLTVTATLGTIDLDTTDGTFLANKYVTYAFTNGQLDEAGTWSARVVYTDIVQRLVSDLANFPVGE